MDERNDDWMAINLMDELRDTTPLTVNPITVLAETITTRDLTTWTFIGLDGERF